MLVSILKKFRSVPINNLEDGDSHSSASPLTQNIDSYFKTIQPHSAPHSPKRWVLGSADVDWQSVQTVSSLQSGADGDEPHCSADNQQEAKVEYKSKGSRDYERN